MGFTAVASVCLALRPTSLDHCIPTWLEGHPTVEWKGRPPQCTVVLGLRALEYVSCCSDRWDWAHCAQWYVPNQSGVILPCVAG
jgi:hypothetical protein